MTDTATLDAYGVLTEPATLKIERLLPGTVERVWAYLTQSELRRLWLAAGDMEMKTGAPFELVWRNEELSDPPGRRPDGFPEEQRMESHIIAADPPHRLTFAWRQGEVSFELRPEGNQVLLTIIHRRISDRANMVMIGAGWHMHLNILAERLASRKPSPFWDGWSRLRDEYDRRIPA
ncbi:MAG TPA: SRPBCC family protein [Pseudorhizobium sp.]|nr:SRPBCC family protein [Pseudorhizobium sp.]